jgi:hypothetical protein
MCYAPNPTSSSSTFNAAIGRPTGIGVDQSAFTNTLKANSAAYRLAMHEWNAGGNVGPKPVNPNLVLIRTGVAAVQANRTSRGALSGGGAGSVSRFGG